MLNVSLPTLNLLGNGRLLFRVPFAAPTRGFDQSSPQAAASLHMSPCPVVPCRTPVPPLPREGGSNGGNRRAVSPLAVGEGFQRKPPRNRFPLAAFFLRFLSPPERNRTAGDNRDQREAICKSPCRISFPPGIIHASHDCQIKPDMLEFCYSTL